LDGECNERRTPDLAGMGARQTIRHVERKPRAAHPGRLVVHAEHEAAMKVCTLCDGRIYEPGDMRPRARVPANMADPSYTSAGGQELCIVCWYAHVNNGEDHTMIPLLWRPLIWPNAGEYEAQRQAVVAQLQEQAAAEDAERSATMERVVTEPIPSPARRPLVGSWNEFNDSKAGSWEY
jgi:hypothetical protein